MYNCKKPIKVQPKKIHLNCTQESIITETQQLEKKN